MLREFFLSLKKGFRDERQVIKKIIENSNNQIIAICRKFMNFVSN